MNDLYRHLTSHGVHLSIRKGVLRMSLGLYNNVADIDRTLELTREWVNREGGRTLRGGVKVRSYAS
jgi:cysteine sulfinate desulfinase/cysteine desulfurase-like protein